jgi:hypothetical protein
MSEALTDADKERLHGIRNFLQGKDVPGVVRNLPHLDAVFLCRLIEELYTELDRYQNPEPPPVKEVM